MVIYLDISITTKDLLYQSTNLSISEPMGFSLTFIKSSCRETWAAGLSRMSTSFGTLFIRPLGDQEKSILSKWFRVLEFISLAKKGKPESLEDWEAHIFTHVFTWRSVVQIPRTPRKIRMLFCGYIWQKD